MWLVQVEDWETGETIVIKLDPRKPPAQAVEDLYKAARKQDRTGDAIMPIMQACPFSGAFMCKSCLYCWRLPE